MGFAKIDHRILGSDKLAMLQLEWADVAKGAFGLWAWALTLASQRESDGVIQATDLMAWGDCSRELDALVGVGLVSRTKLGGVEIVGFSRFNRGSVEISEIRKKRSKAARLGGEANKKRLASHRESARLAVPVSVSASVYGSVSDSEISDQNSDTGARDPWGDGSDPRVPVNDRSGLDARIRSALRVGYARAIEAHTGGLATDAGQPADVTISAVEHAARKLDCDPVELASRCAAVWLARRTTEARPRWRYFEADLGAVLAGMLPAPSQSRQDAPGGPQAPAKPLRIVERDGTILAVVPGQETPIVEMPTKSSGAKK